MADTTTAFTACDAVIELRDIGGVLRDISGSTNKIETTFENKIGEFRTLGGSQWPNRLQCGKDATFKVTGIASTAVNEIKDIIEDWFFNGSGLRTLRFAQPAGTSGSKRYSGEVVLVDFKFSDDAADPNPVMFEINFKPSGAFVRNTI